MSSIWTPGGERPVSREPDPEHDLDEDDQQLLEQELAAMQEQLANTPASVVIANHAVGLFQLAALHLNRRNLTEGRLAIDAMGALVEGLTGRLGEEESALKDGLTQLRMAFVSLQGEAEGDA